MNQEAGPGGDALGLGAGVVVLLIFLQYRRKAGSMTKPVNNRNP
jgi:hypothetical protein